MDAYLDSLLWGLFFGIGGGIGFFLILTLCLGIWCRYEDWQKRR